MEIRSFNKFGGRALWSEDDQRQGFELLKRDPLFPRIPADAAPAIVEDALSVGAVACEQAVERWGTRDPMVLAKYMNVQILYDISSGGAAPLSILSRYRHRPPAVIIHESVLRRCRERLERRAVSDLRRAAASLTDICIAHELFHHIECRNMSFVNLGFKVAVLDLGILRIEKSLTVLSEIAAHAFARRMLNLPFLPCVLNTALFENA